MRIYRLRFRGSGFVLSMPPEGQIIDGFTCTMYLKSASELAARESGLAELHADATVAAMIKESREAQVETWKMECETVSRLGLWRHLLPMPKRVFISHWMDEQKTKVAA
jgi:hypothetical protein